MSEFTLRFNQFKPYCVTREMWLQTKWQRYPAAGSDWLDVATFLKSPQATATVGGRLTMRGANSSIDWAGESLSFTFSSQPEWLESGDLVALKLERFGDGYRAADVQLLAPALTSHESKPSAGSAFTISRSREWALFISALRGFFSDQDFIEVQTPTLVPSPGTEPFLDPFKTEWEIGSRKKTFYLPTSPEFHLKRFLANGWSRVFELKNCFRNGEIGAHHQPEFLMLEWYRAFATLEAIADDVDGLLQTLSKAFSQTIPRLKRVTISELFKEAFDGFVLYPDTSADELRKLAAKSSVAVDSSDSFDDVFFRLFLEKIEPTLGQTGPLLVSHYPPSQAALSRIGAHGFAERFEIYWKGVELANAFHELNDPFENEKRFDIDAQKKNELGKAAVPRDENLVAALRAGMPPSGGIALGVDRLFMVLFGCQTIAETRAFPVLDSELTRRD